MAGFLFKLETADGAPAEPPQFRSAIPGWGAGDAFPLGAGRTLLVLAVRENENDELPVLVVEDSRAST
jgi:hypothetical protein